ncbi:hypothetical protein NDU88_006908 [Pleurodeles waltl]|uniref:Uncharacterized protein n=1 Tax=Pleurodeles waltl TaxID=8319 RepID=A0AAV7N5F0_PLEWA|nr:hypothetical protein NDU88_006908 [Pleurodeles waltl]
MGGSALDLFLYLQIWAKYKKYYSEFLHAPAERQARTVLLTIDSCCHMLTRLYATIKARALVSALETRDAWERDLGDTITPKEWAFRYAQTDAMAPPIVVSA